MMPVSRGQKPSILRIGIVPRLEESCGSGVNRFRDGSHIPFSSRGQY